MPPRGCEPLQATGIIADDALNWTAFRNTFILNSLIKLLYTILFSNILSVSVCRGDWGLGFLSAASGRN